jgi:hypothetical protein
MHGSRGETARVKTKLSKSGTKRQESPSRAAWGFSEDVSLPTDLSRPRAIPRKTPREVVAVMTPPSPTRLPANGPVTSESSAADLDDTAKLPFCPGCLRSVNFSLPRDSTRPREVRRRVRRKVGFRSISRSLHQALSREISSANEKSCGIRTNPAPALREVDQSEESSDFSRSAQTPHPDPLTREKGATESGSASLGRYSGKRYPEGRPDEVCRF